MKTLTVKNMVVAAIIAAMYAALTIAFAPICYKDLQFRISEALTVLPIFTIGAIPGLTLGCVISNIYGVVSGNNPISAIDILVGSAATLISAIVTYQLAKILKNATQKYIFGPLPTVLINAIVIGAELTIMVGGNIIFNVLLVGIGELAVCYILGVPLMFALYKNNLYKKIF